MSETMLIVILVVVLYLSGFANILAVLMLKEKEERLVAEIKNNEKLSNVINLLANEK